MRQNLVEDEQMRPSPSASTFTMQHATKTVVKASSFEEEQDLRAKMQIGSQLKQAGGGMRARMASPKQP